MWVEYTASKAARVRWCHGGTQSTGKFIAGSYDNLDKNSLTLWSVDVSSSDDGVDFIKNDELPFVGDVTQIVTFGKSALVTSSEAFLALYDVTGAKERLSFVKQWANLDLYSCTDIVYLNGSSTAVICGKGGYLSLVNLGKTDARPEKTKAFSQSTLECIESLSEHEVICGNESGHLKVIDLRSKAVGLSLCHSLAIVTCVKKNPNNSHIVASGNDSGTLSLWDLRNSASHLLHLSAHNGLITELNYKPDESNTIITSSSDGQLLRWDLSSSSQFEKVDAIMGGKEGDLCLSSFDVEASNEIVFASDSEALYYGQL